MKRILLLLFPLLMFGQEISLSPNPMTTYSVGQLWGYPTMSWSCPDTYGGYDFTHAEISKNNGSSFVNYAKSGSESTTVEDGVPVQLRCWYSVFNPTATATPVVLPQPYFIGAGGPGSIIRGQAAELGWSCINGASVGIEPGGLSGDAVGSVTVYPTTTTTYTFTCWNSVGDANGTVSADDTVIVLQPTPKLIIITEQSLSCKQGDQRSEDPARRSHFRF